MKKLAIKSIAVLCLGAFIFTGCQKDNDTDVDTNTGSGKTTTEETKDALDDSDGGQMKVDTETKASPKAPEELKLKDAYEIYNEKYPDSQIKEMSLEEDNNMFVYKFSGVKDGQAYEVKVNAEDLSLVNEGLDDDIDKDDNDVTFKFEDYSNVEEYVKDILAENDGYYFKEWKVEEDDDQFVLKLEIRKDSHEIDYKINPSDGTVIEKDE